MQEKIKITKTDEQGGISFFNLNLSIDKSLFKELVAMYFLTAERENKAEGETYLIYSNSEAQGLTWTADSLKVRGFSPYVVINDLRLLENSGSSSMPTDEETAKIELGLYGIEISEVDNTKF